MCFPGTILSPGYVEENKVKPEITLKIEESDTGRTPDQVADALVRGVEQGKFHITYDFAGNVFRASSRGASPGNFGPLDALYNLIGSVGPAALLFRARMRY